MSSAKPSPEADEAAATPSPEVEAAAQPAVAGKAAAAGRTTTTGKPAAAGKAAPAAKPSEAVNRGASVRAADLAAENERLRARLQALEAELVEIQARADTVVASAQARTYWLDRWHLDLNALMRRPGAAEVRASVRGARWIVRRFRNLKRRWRAR